MGPGFDSDPAPYFITQSGRETRTERLVPGGKACWSRMVLTAHVKEAKAVGNQGRVVEVSVAALGMAKLFFITLRLVKIIKDYIHW